MAAIALAKQFGKLRMGLKSALTSLQARLKRVPSKTRKHVALALGLVLVVLTLTRDRSSCGKPQGPSLNPSVAAAGGEAGVATAPAPAVLEQRFDITFEAPPAPRIEGPFIYVYDFGPRYTDDILSLKPSWYSKQYDVERELTKLLLAAPSGTVRTNDPQKASLFFVPFYSARFTLYHFKDWEVNMEAAIRKTSEMWSEVLTRVRNEHPYFNRTNGRDHFGVLTMDHGRCSALTFVRPELYGDMFFVTYNGDKMVRSDNSDPKRNMQAISYNYNVPRSANLPSIPCYMPDRDIVVPPLVTTPLVAPNATARHFTITFRFSSAHHHGVPIRHHGHEIRREILERFFPENIPGWSFDVKDEKSTNRDWLHTLFCACPPGHSQWTSRPFKCLMAGGVPVTFFREHDNPFQDVLDYATFSVNVDPDDIASLRTVLDTLLYTPGRLEALQQAVAQVQQWFQWTRSWESGAELMLLQQLRRRAASIKLHRDVATTLLD